MCAKSIDQIITFKGEYPAYLLQPFRELVSVVVPYDECARDFDRSDTLALFELLDLSGLFSTEFAAQLLTVSKNFFDFMQSEVQRLPNKKRSDAYHNRINRSLHRIAEELRLNGYPMVHLLFLEMLAITHGLQNDQIANEYGVPREHENRLRQRAACSPGAEREREDIAWYMLAHTVQQSVKACYVGGIQQATEMREVLRTIDLNLDIKEGCLYVDSDNLAWGLHHYLITILPADHPLSLCRVELRHRTANHLPAIAEVRRNDGHLTFESCSLFTVQAPFKRLSLDDAYSYLCDVVTYSVYEALVRGVIKERCYLQPEESESIEPSPAVEAPPASPISEEVAVEMPIARVVSVRVGHSRFSYRNIISTLMRFGVRIDPGGRHLKLRLGNATSPFLNSHRRQNPHHNRQVLKEALARLGIDEQDFMAAL